MIKDKKHTATFNLSEETIKKLDQITFNEIIETGSIRSKSQVLRDLILKHHKRLFKKTTK